jgi:tRNA threonylcarbamoyladenosine biosynthesis protein TsaB
VTWTAHRELGMTLHTKIKDLLQKQNLDWNDIEGIVCFKGPGSFTGLRIGLSVGNALAQANSLPIIGAEGEDWIQDGIRKLAGGTNDKVVIPEYGGEVLTTKPKK